MLIWVKWNGINYFLFNTNYKDKRDDDLLHLILLFSIGSLKLAFSWHLKYLVHLRKHPRKFKKMDFQTLTSGCGLIMGSDWISTHQILVAMAAAKTTAKRTKIIISISVELRISSI